MPAKKISELTSGTAVSTSVVPASNAAGTETTKLTLAAILALETRWSLFLPPAPTNVTATAGNAQVSLSWSAPSVLSVTPITDYIVQFSTNSGSTWTTFSDGTSTATSVTVTGLTNGTAYVFRAAAANAVGTGSYSSATSSVIPGDVFRAIPTMTSNTAPSGVVSGASNGDDNNLWKFFDGNEGTFAYLMRYGYNSPLRSLQYAFPDGQKSRIGGYAFTPQDGFTSRGPLQWKFYGSDDLSSWTLVETRASVTWANTNARTFTLASPVNYRAYKWEFGYDDAENDPIAFQTVQLVE